MEALYNYNIKIVEGNPFALLVPFVKRTFVSCKPIDEDIDVLALEYVVAKFGGVEYPAEKTPGGVLVRIPGTLPPENYDLIVTAKYYGTDIRAAYKAVTIVSWNEQSNAQQYVQGSPVVLPAAFYIASLTDAELEQLKQDLRDAIAAAEDAEQAAEQAKQEWEQKAAELDGVAQQGDNPAATNTAILQAIQQGGGDVAKESTSQDILALLAAKTIPFTLGGCEFVNTVEVPDCAGAMANVANCTKLVSDKLSTAPQVRSGWSNIKEVICRAADSIQTAYNIYTQNSYCEIYEAENAITFTGYGAFANYIFLRKLNIKSLYTNTLGSNFYFVLSSVNNLIDLIIGKNLHLADTGFLNNFLYTWIPTNAMLENSQSLLMPEDIAAGFTSNLEKFLYNLREHFAANLADLTGQASKSIRFSAEVKSVILADQPTADAFTNKNWTIA